jgi:hypothetical protein
MDSIRIETGVKKIQINDGPEYIEFNPADVSFAERFYQLIQDFEVKQVEYQKRAEILDAGSNLVDANGIPINFPAGLAMMREVCEFMRVKIDGLFGKDTSRKCFGDALSLDMFGQFFTGITPFIKTARTEKVAKYQKKPHSKKVMS